MCIRHFCKSLFRWRGIGKVPKISCESKPFTEISVYSIKSARETKQQKMASGFPQSRAMDRPPEYRESFKTKEGVYRNAKSSTYSRPTKAPYFSKHSVPVNLSLAHTRGSNAKGWISFNVGKELYCYEQCKVGEVCNCIILRGII